MQGNLIGTFQTGGFFSPGLPPIPPDPQPSRRLDFPAGVNLQYTPRTPEAFDFPHLRAFSNVELVRLAIETRKDQIERLDWSVRVRHGRKRRSDSEERCRSVEKFLRKPDGEHHFATWFRMLVEDMLTIDAATIERRKSLSGKLIGLDVVDGATIKLLVDAQGRRPRAPAPAFQQVIKGRIWNDLTTEDIIYAPRNVRSNHLYGFSCVEQVVVTLNTAMQRQAMQLAYFTDSTIPAGIISVPEGWTIDQVKDWQDWMDARLSGNLAERSKVMWAPAGAKYIPFKDSPIKDEFDEWLARIVCYAFSLPPTAFIKQMNRSTSESDQDRSNDEGFRPLLLWAKRLFDSIIQDDLGFTDLEFAWDLDRAIEPVEQAKIDDMRLRNGSRTLNEVRDQDGLDPYPFGNDPMIYTATGVVRLEHSIEAAELPPEEPDPASAPAKQGAEPTTNEAPK